MNCGLLSFAPPTRSTGAVTATDRLTGNLREARAKNSGVIRAELGPRQGRSADLQSASAVISGDCGNSPSSLLQPQQPIHAPEHGRTCTTLCTCRFSPFSWWKFTLPPGCAFLDRKATAERHALFDMTSKTGNNYGMLLREAAVPLSLAARGLRRRRTEAQADAVQRRLTMQPGC